MGAIFCFRRHLSTENKYVCECGGTFSNRYSLDHHVTGKLATSHGPCPVMRNKALEVVATSAICDDESLAINYWPEPNPHVQTESDVDDLENVHAEPIDSVENVFDETIDPAENVPEESISDHESANLDLRDLLEENYRALDDAINVLHKAQSNIKRALADFN
ncbi:hypothetical protein BGZ89_012358 [Linnemannia elongata]|nr:hypothetical protein BGZ89_012358 [Linnemannia elongata]